MTKITEKNKRMGINSLIYILIFILESLKNFGFIKLENRKYLKCVLLSVKHKGLLIRTVRNFYKSAKKNFS